MKVNFLMVASNFNPCLSSLILLRRCNSELTNNAGGGRESETGDAVDRRSSAWKTPHVFSMTLAFVSSLARPLHLLNSRFPFRLLLIRIRRGLPAIPDHATGPAATRVWTVERDLCTRSSFPSFRAGTQHTHHHHPPIIIKRVMRGREDTVHCCNLPTFSLRNFSTVVCSAWSMATF